MGGTDRADDQLILQQVWHGSLFVLPLMAHPHPYGGRWCCTLYAPLDLLTAGWATGVYEDYGLWLFESF